MENKVEKVVNKNNNSSKNKTTKRYARSGKGSVETKRETTAQAKGSQPAAPQSGAQTVSRAKMDSQRKKTAAAPQNEANKQADLKNAGSATNLAQENAAKSSAQALNGTKTAAQNAQSKEALQNANGEQSEQTTQTAEAHRSTHRKARVNKGKAGKQNAQSHALAVSANSETTTKDAAQEVVVSTQENAEQEEEVTSDGVIRKSFFDKRTESAVNKVKRKKSFSYANAKRIKSKANKGLTIDEVQDRINSGYVNLIHDKNKKTYFQIFFKNICTYFNLLCFLVAIALICVGAFDNIFFMVIILANTAIGIVQEIRAKKAMEKISLVTQPTALVVRDGKHYEIPVKEVVLDDIIEFSLGKQICADCVVVSGEVEVNESLITGESNAVKKKVGDRLLSGSFISSGECVARADAVGDASYTAQLSAKAKEYSQPKSELMKSMRIIISVIGVIIIPLGILMLGNNYSQGGSDMETIKKTAGSIIGMIPAGMFLLTSMALAVGVVKLASKRTLVQDLYSIEMLSRVDTLCLDKTGTITDGTMVVTEVEPISKTISETDLYKIVGTMMSGLGDNNATSRALIDYFGKQDAYHITAKMPFSSARKLSAVSFSNGNTYIVGASEFVLDEVSKELEEKVKDYAKQGKRVLLLAKARGKIVDETLPTGAKPVALIAIEDRIRENATETLRWFQDNDVDLKIISGDNPITVSEIAKRVGVPNAQSYINLYGLSDQQVIEAADKHTVFGRVTPEQKSVLVKALKQRGHKVAMTGDGVNDILALKEADCSIAMASGSDATRNVSNLVLLDSNFSAMPSIVAEGRRVVNNVTKSSSLFLMKTFFTIFLSIMCLALAISYPFTPNAVILLELFAIGLPSFFLALQPNKDPIRGNFLVNLITKSIPSALLLLLNFFLCYLFDITYSDGTHYETMASICITFSGLILLLRVSRPLDSYRLTLFGAMLVLCLSALAILPQSFFGHTYLDFQSILVCLCVIELGFLWLIKPITPPKELRQKNRKLEMRIGELEEQTYKYIEKLKRF